MYSTVRHRRRNVQRTYREYVCDSLQGAPQGKYLQQRFTDLVSVDKSSGIDAESIVNHVIEVLEG